MRVLATSIFCILLLYLFPSVALSDVIVHDMIVLKGKDIMLSAETRGRLFVKGGEGVEFFVDGRSIGRSLSGGDGMAFRQFKPLRIGIYKITAKSEKDEVNGLILSLKKGDRIVFIDVVDGLFEGRFSNNPKPGSQKIIKKLIGRYPVVFLQTGLFSINAVKTWLDENGFVKLPVIPWEQGAIFDEVSKKGLRIKAVIGSKAVIESAKEFNPKAFSFDEVEDAEEVKDWEEIGKKLSN